MDWKPPLFRLIAVIAMLAQTLAPGLASARADAGGWMGDAICAPSGTLSPEAGAETILALYAALAGDEDDSGDDTAEGGHCPACLLAAACLLPGPVPARPGPVDQAPDDLLPSSALNPCAPVRGPPLGQRGPPSFLGSALSVI